MGYHRAGFDVVGVDHRPMPRYPFEFHQADALEYIAEHGAEYDAIHASPPCQAYSDLRALWPDRHYPDLVGPTRDALMATGLPWIIENVEGSPVAPSFTLCGSMFGLAVEGRQLRRHRHFELGWPRRPASRWFALLPPCAHRSPTLGVYGDHVRDRRRSVASGRGQFLKVEGIRLASIAMEIDWMTGKELSQAIPPAYTEWIGAHLLAALRQAA